MNKFLIQKNRRKKRIRMKIIGLSKYPRLSIYRSAKHIYCQLIDDKSATTLVFENDFDSNKQKITKTDKAIKVGQKIAQKIKKLEINQIVIDRGCYKYTGRIKAMVNAIRNSGIKI